jgi:UDP-glucose 4-epimerase
MDCLVSGGAGFIGSHIVDALVARGDRVAILDNLSTGSLENVASAVGQGAKLHAVDVRDAEAVTEVFAHVRPEVVFHLAAEVDVRRSVEDPVGNVMTNVIGTVNVLDAARRTEVRRVVNTSTGGGIYGDANVYPTPETELIEPLAPYGQSKYAAEGYCAVYSRLHGLSTASLRYANVYGPRQDPHGEGGVVAIFCGCLLEGRRPTIYGDGGQTRDWVEVSDVVRANLVTAESDLPGPVNIGRGEETSVLDLVSALNEIAGPDRGLDPQFAPERPGEARRSCLDVSRVASELGWRAEVELRTGLRRIIEAAS